MKVNSFKVTEYYKQNLETIPYKNKLLFTAWFLDYLTQENRVGYLIS